MSLWECCTYQGFIEAGSSVLLACSGCCMSWVKKCWPRPLRRTLPPTPRLLLATGPVQLGPSPFCKPNYVHEKYIYSQINASLRDVRSSGQNDVRLRAIKSSREECQTHHCQHNSMNIGDKSQTEKWGWSIKTKPIVAKPKAKTEDYFKTILITP